MAKKFYSSDHAAQAAGYSLRHFHRKAERLHIQPMRIRQKCFWFGEDVERIRHHREQPANIESELATHARQTGDGGTSVLIESTAPTG